MGQWRSDLEIRIYIGYLILFNFVSTSPLTLKNIPKNLMTENIG